MFRTIGVVIFQQINKQKEIFRPKIHKVFFCQRVAAAVKPKKPKSERTDPRYFTDTKRIRAIGGKGGDGCISFLHLWCNEKAGPDGGDGGNGGHVILEASMAVKNFNHVMSILKGDEGEKGSNKDMHGRNANHTVVKVPIGTIVRNDVGKVVGDLDKEKLMFVVAKGGRGGRGNHYFISDLEQAPQICEYGGEGEDLVYLLELKSMADIGFIGLPNAGKSTLLRAISRARPKVAPYPFTTLRPHIGMILYDDYEQIAAADLPGLIPGSHKNKGLGIQFLKHAERCAVLFFVVDASSEEPWEHYNTLIYELSQFSEELASRPQIIVANKIDLPEAEGNLRLLKENVKVPVVGVSAKEGTNIDFLLREIKILYERNKKKD